MSISTVVLSQESPLSNLTVADDGSTYQLLRLGRPGVRWRMSQAPDSANVHGTEFTGAVKENSEIPLDVMVKAASSAALNTAVVALEDALAQFSYTTTVTVDGVAKVWRSAPASISAASGLIESGHVAQFFEVLTITIPVYPIAS